MDASAVDWDCLGAADNAAAVQDINGDGIVQVTDHLGHDDWSNLDLRFQCARGANFADEPSMDEGTAATLGLLLQPWDARIDVVPGCAANPVPTGGGGGVDVVLFGDPGWDSPDLVPARATFMQAPIRRVEVYDVDGDGQLDHRMHFDADQFRIEAGAAVSYFQVRLADSRVLTAMEPILGVAELDDPDGDGVDALCDQCPDSPPGAAVGDDGCP